MNTERRTIKVSFTREQYRALVRASVVAEHTARDNGDTAEARLQRSARSQWHYGWNSHDVLPMYTDCDALAFED